LSPLYTAKKYSKNYPLAGCKGYIIYRSRNKGKGGEKTEGGREEDDGETRKEKKNGKVEKVRERRREARKEEGRKGISRPHSHF